ncbi:trypsin-like peptidase domain-containing protein [Streptomyces cinerochromogenes]|uniref:trypsin-like peptidase domain-containing protein n=1 Tax=Streptomyces cinerochromogenes TaxID=66422 RepID=UPI0016713959|nr:trypsin-like peptidase domain-containing protein [Streptomyces cinerochromogenes]GGS98880.1 hypothetical protein GCM10010206_71970 [Streptomyces cinerochromogenes]
MTGVSAGGAAGGVGLQKERVAQIIVEPPDGGPGDGERSSASRGSGYLVAAATVLTAAHVVRDVTRVRVRLPSDRPEGREFTANVRWRHDGIDIAVLTLVAPDRARIEVAPTPLGRVGEHDRPLPCSAVGYPLYKMRDDPAGRYRDAAHLHDTTCAPLSNSRGGTLELNVPVPPAGPGSAQSPWEGMSGAAVFSGGRIVGVIGQHHAWEGPGRLDAGHVGRWAELLGRDSGDGSAAEGGEALLRDLEALLRQSLRHADLPDVVPQAAGPRRLPRGVRPHAQVLARSVHGKKYLTDDQLLFVRPRGGRHPADPHQLWSRLSGGTPRAVRGVMLVGQAGTGKTRTCFEVAARADGEGWSVFHAGVGAAVTAEDLVDVVRGVPGRKVLFVFDYLDTYAELNLTHLANDLEYLAEWEAPGTRVACVASVRPGALPAVERQNPEWHRVFDPPQEVCQDPDHQQAVAERILDRVAGGAVDQYGRRNVAALCGRRPVPAVVLMRGQEIQSAVREGATLQQLQNGAGRHEYAPLTVWTRQRAEADLATLPGEAETTRLASAVAAAACPQDRQAVQDAVRYLLDHHDGPALATGAKGVIDGLLDRGWLVLPDGESGEIDVMHDVVTDDYLRQACFRDDWFRAETVQELLSAFLVSTRTLHLAAGHLRRWVTDLDEGRRAQVRTVCDGWLDAHATTLGERLSAAAERVEAGATLLTLLTGPPWQSGAAAAWDRLVAPWLRAAEREAPHLVRNLFAAAIRNTADAVPEPLATAAVAWLRRNRDAPDARAVAESLVRANGLPDPVRTAAVAEAVEWLATHGVAPRHRPVFAALLDRDDLAPAVRERVLDLGLAGIRRYLPVAATAHVLRTVLTLRDLPHLGGDRLLRVVDLAHQWLAAHPEERMASYVLPSLLVRTEVDTPRRTRAIERALTWLGARGTDPIASFVLRQVLDHSDLSADAAARAVDCALRWLRSNDTAPDASFVLGPLLVLCGREQTRHPAWDTAWTTSAVEHALVWLDRDDHGTSERAAYVVWPLLDQRSLPRGTRGYVSEWALAWLGVHGEREQARPVLSALLGLPSEEPYQHARLACAFALDWLEDHHTTRKASYVLSSLLSHIVLRGERAEEAARYALDWLDRHATDDAASEAVSFVLKSLLTKRDLPAEQTRKAVGVALDWLEPRHTEQVARFVLGAVLPHAGEDGDDRAAAFALAWSAGDHGGAANAAYVLGPLLARKDPDPDPDRAGRLVALAVRWLETHRDTREAKLVVWPLLAQRGLDADQRRLAAEVALLRAAASPEELDQRRLASLAQLGPLPPEQGAAIADHVLARLEDESAAQALLPYALWRRDIRGDQADRLVDRALELLAADPTLHRRRVLLRALLARPDLDTGRAAQAAARARTWLAGRITSSQAGRILQPLLARHDLNPADGHPGPTTATLTLDWLAAQDTHYYAGDVLLTALSRPDPSPAQTRAYAAHARTWLTTADPGDERVPRLRALLPPGG